MIGFCHASADSHPTVYPFLSYYSGSSGATGRQPLGATEGIVVPGSIGKDVDMR
jgi:hypothetical protein